MARKAAVISIDVQAGTAKMLVDLEKAKGGLREFGATSKSASDQRYPKPRRQVPRLRR